MAGLPCQYDQKVAVGIPVLLVHPTAAVSQQQQQIQVGDELFAGAMRSVLLRRGPVRRVVYPFQACRVV
jgi:hypothetical protein